MQRSSAKTGDRPRSVSSREPRCARSLPRSTRPPPVTRSQRTRSSRPPTPAQARVAAVTCSNRCARWSIRANTGGIRHRLVSILALAAAAVVAGARSSVAAEQWAANAPAGVLGALEVRIHPRTGRYVVPCESTIRRPLQACDGDQLDAVLGAWLYPRLDTEQVIVDGKTLRGARAGDGRAGHGPAATPGWAPTRRAGHVLAAMLGGTRTVMAQREIAHKTNEITAFAPLLEDLHLAGALITA